jgi:hypothetical protein
MGISIGHNARMVSEDNESYTQLVISLEQVIVVQGEEFSDEYGDNYVRRLAGPIRLEYAETEQEVEIGEIELFFVDGTRALDNGLDIVDVCDSMGQDQYDYAAAVYSDGVLDSEIVADSIFNDVLALHTISILPQYRGHQHGLLATRKIIEALGSHCGAVVLNSPPQQFSGQAEDKAWVDRMGMTAFENDLQAATKRLTDYWRALDLRSTKDPSIFCITQFEETAVQTGPIPHPQFFADLALRTCAQKKYANLYVFPGPTCHVGTIFRAAGCVQWANCLKKLAC